MIKSINIGATLILLLFLTACSLSKRQKTDLGMSCCKECLEAFNQSPVGIGAEGARCGQFTSAKVLSQPCRDYFKKHTVTVADCK